MSRSLKFRVWSKNENKYLSQDDLVNFWIRPNDFTTCFMEWRSGFDGETMFETKESDFVYQQYTGLKDKNNKEIYDGDILQYNNLRYEVRWDEYEWKAVCSYYNKYHWPTIEPFGLVGCSIVVGNTFENPELLINNK